MWHIGLHFLIPAVVASIFFRQNWRVAYVVMMLTMLVDLDHLFASPIYDPNRCSMGFHPLHTLPFVALYAVMCFLKRTRFIGIGLVIHMALDAIDCQLTNGVWFTAH